jgi:Ca2+-binding EF-hand superfamily protein
MDEKKKYQKNSTRNPETISLKRIREIMKEEEIEYTDEELNEILDFVSNVITITIEHYKRIKG